MKMLFYSSDDERLGHLTLEFLSAGIPFEIRKTKRATNGNGTQAELWIQDDRDCHRALMLCVQRKIGFARRPETGLALEREETTEISR